MANGILKDEATYFNDSETYTGDSGSETNRWVIEDTYDFIVIGIGNAERHYRLVKDINFNEHPMYKDGFNRLKVAYSQAGSFDGDGHSIKNVILRNYDMRDETYPKFMYFHKICNVDFVNLIMTNCTANAALISGWSNIDGRGEMKNCNFGIFVSNCSPIALPFAGMHIERCCFNIKGTLITNFYITGRVYQTWIKLDVTIDCTTLLHSNQNDAIFDNSYITGIVTNNSKLNYSSISDIPFSNSYIAVEYIEHGTPHSEQWIKGTGFIDRELWNKGGSGGVKDDTLSGYVTPVTTAQAQDVDYLNSIGFAVVPVS